MSFDPQTTAAFTGHRTYVAEAVTLLRIAVATLHARGIRTFLCGMATGFDLAAAEAVIDSRERMPDLRLVAVIPFEGQQARFSAVDQERYRRIREAADEEVCLAEEYFPGCYLRRNDFLIAHASVVVAWYDGKGSGNAGRADKVGTITAGGIRTGRSSSGTGYTVMRAERLGREIINLYPQAAQEQVLF